MDSFCLDPRPLVFFFLLRVLLIGAQERLYNTLDALTPPPKCLSGTYKEHRFHCTECIFTYLISQKCLFPFFCFFSSRIQKLILTSLSGLYCFSGVTLSKQQPFSLLWGYIIIKELKCFWVTRVWTVRLTGRALNPGADTDTLGIWLFMMCKIQHNTYLQVFCEC